MTFEYRLSNEEADLRIFAGRESSKHKGLELGIHVVCKRNSKKTRVAEWNRLRGEQWETRSPRQPCSHCRL